MKQLDGISRRLGQGDDPRLEALQRDLWKEYEEVLGQEELL